MLHGTKNFYFFAKLLQPDSANSQSQFLDDENSAWKHVCVQKMIFWLGRSKQMLQNFHWIRKSIKYLVPITSNSCSAKAALNWLVLEARWAETTVFWAQCHSITTTIILLSWQQLPRKLDFFLSVFYPSLVLIVHNNIIISLEWTYLMKIYFQKSKS